MFVSHCIILLVNLIAIEQPLKSVFNVRSKMFLKSSRLINEACCQILKQKPRIRKCVKVHTYMTNDRSFRGKITHYDSPMAFLWKSNRCVIFETIGFILPISNSILSVMDFNFENSDASIMVGTDYNMYLNRSLTIVLLRSFLQ